MFVPFSFCLMQAAGEAADTYIVINATCVELLNVRDYVQRKAPKGEAFDASRSRG